MARLEEPRQFGTYAVALCPERRVGVRAQDEILAVGADRPRAVTGERGQTALLA
jgi:hypothetical protein